MFKKKAFVVRSNRDGNSLVDLATGQRSSYKGAEEAGALLTRSFRMAKLKSLGCETNVGDVATAHAFGLPLVNEREALISSELAKADIDLYPLKRRDLRHLITFTIDGAHAKDLDDAISILPEGSGYRVWVHIADVAATLKKDCYLDKHAAKRLTSLYWPEGSHPMLPRVLSESTLSLLPHVDRRAFTLELFFQDGEITSSEFYPSLINSNAQLTYPQVTSILRGESAYFNENLGEDLNAELNGALINANLVAGVDPYFEEESREPHFVVEAGVVTSYSYETITASNKLIEFFMVRTNVEAGKFLRAAGFPAPYRAHSIIDRDRALDAIAKVRTFVDLPADCDLYEARSIVASLDHPKKAYLERFLLQVTPPAIYQSEAAPHEGLHEEVYVHFTSPIRRYPDLMIHRIMHELLLGNKSPYSKRAMDKTLNRINLATTAAKKSSRAMNDVYLNSHLAKEVSNGYYRGKIFARVEGFAKHGAFCDFGHGKNGFMFLDQLGPGELNEEGTIFVGKYRTVAIGDTINVSLGRPDLSRGRVNMRIWRERSGKRR